MPASRRLFVPVALLAGTALGVSKVSFCCYFITFRTQPPAPAPREDRLYRTGAVMAVASHHSRGGARRQKLLRETRSTIVASLRNIAAI
jgi:hypothetical protein